MSIQAIDDKQLVKQLLGKGPGLDQALHTIYTTYRNLVEQLILKNDGSIEEAKDVFQDTVIDFYENVRNGKFKGQSAISTYLYSIARFKWLNRLKRKKTETRIIDTQQTTDIEWSFEEEYLEQEKKNEIMKLFNALGASCKDLLTHTIYHNYSMAEAAKKLNYNSEQVVRNQKYRCMKKLKELLLQNPDLLQILKA